MDKKVKYWLTALFLIVLAIRLVLAFYNPNFTYESYFHFREVESVSNTGLPIYQDTLSAGGKDFVYLPLFYYLTALFNLVIPIEIIGKILPNLLISSLIVVIYFIANKITNNETASLLSAFIVGLLPVLYYTNNFTPSSLFLLLAFLTIYYFLRLNDGKKYIYYYIISFLFLSLTSSAAFLLIIGFVFYLLLSYIEHKKVNRPEAELIIFSIFFFIWMQFLFYKNIFLKDGISFIWQNVPSEMLKQYFPQLSVPTVVLLVSIIPFIVGIYTIYLYLFQQRSQKIVLMISLAISTAMMTWFRLIKLEVALSFFGVILAVLFAIFYQDLKDYLEKTKISGIQKYLLPTVIILLLVTMIIPLLDTSFSQNMPSNEEIQAFKWLKENTPLNVGVLALLEEGHLVTYYSQRKNILDDQFILTDNAQQRFQDLNDLFSTKFQTHALNLLERYQVQYLVFTPLAKKKYEQNRFDYVSNSCFKRIYENETRIYQLKCKLGEISLSEASN